MTKIKYGKVLGVLALAFTQLILAQKKEVAILPEKPSRPAFEGSFVINNPSNVLFPAKTLEIQIKHRFGLINGGDNDLAGIWGPSNIRLGATYAVSDRVTIGYGTTKFNRLHEFSLKGAILRQTRSNSMPISVSYYGNTAIDGRKKEHFTNDLDRFSYFHQLIIARRFNRNFSAQLAPSVSHYNLIEDKQRNDRIALGIAARHKISFKTAILLDLNFPFTHHLEGVKFENDPEPGFAIGVEFATAGHAFQIFVGNYSSIVPQQDIMFNQNKFFQGDMLFGFNITRSYSF